MEIVCFTSKIVVLETKSYYIVGLNCNFVLNNVNKIPTTLFCPVIVILALNVYNLIYVGFSTPPVAEPFQTTIFPLG